jgi:hypothetical protein
MYSPKFPNFNKFHVSVACQAAICEPPFCISTEYSINVNLSGTNKETSISNPICLFCVAVDKEQNKKKNSDLECSLTLKSPW